MRRFSLINDKFDGEGHTLPPPTSEFSNNLPCATIVNLCVYVASDTPHTLICSDEASRLGWYKSPGNSMLLRGISGVVLGYSRLDGGAVRARVGERQFVL